MNPTENHTSQEQGHTHIPLKKEIIIDQITPLTLYQQLANQPYTYFFESVQGGEQWGRYSIIGLPCKNRIEVHHKTIKLFKEDDLCIEKEVSDPLTWIHQYHAQYQAIPVENLPRCTGGLVGYFGYDTVKLIEPCLEEHHCQNTLKTPDIALLVSEELIIFDNLTSTAHIIVYAATHLNNTQEKQQRLIEIENQILKLTPQNETIKTSTHQEELSNEEITREFLKEDYIAAVDKIKEYIVEGDVMQVVLSQRFHTCFEQTPFNLYRCLRHLNPSPYLYYIDMQAFQIVGSSPEILVRQEQDTITVRPLAGTRPRGKNKAQDEQLEKELLNDPKELAEHLMLIDLGRNDISRISEAGSVTLTEKMHIEHYSHVMHIVSNVIGKKLADKHALDILKATFPAGTVSGAPKIRAMEIINELEPVKRGIYAGAVGYWAWNGDMDIAIAIRTAVIKDQKVYIQAGAGIVHDSIPEKEWEETLNKGKAMLKAVTMAKNLLQNNIHEEAPKQQTNTLSQTSPVTSPLSEE